MIKTFIGVGCKDLLQFLELYLLFRPSGRLANFSNSGNVSKKGGFRKGNNIFRFPTKIYYFCDVKNQTEKVDFVLAFYMVHEVSNQKKFMEDLSSILKPKGTALIVEPKFHVSKKAFCRMVDITKEVGFTICDNPKVFLSRTIALKKNE